MSARRCLITALAVLALAAPAARAQQTLLVHLPSAPVQAAGDQAGAVTALAEYLSARLPDSSFEAKIFRRWRDAQDHLEAHSAEVTLMLSDASFAASGIVGLTPAYRFERGGSSTYRRLLVVRADRPELGKLIDLESRTLALVETAGADADAASLRREIFEGALDPAALFSEIKPEVDDFAATASVLYGQTDAALVADYNPLLASHLGKELRSVFESPELSLPVLSVRESAFTATDREALGRALEALNQGILGRLVLADLGIDGIRPLIGAALARTPERQKNLSIASSGGVTVELAPPPLPAPEQLSFSVGVELPEIPLPLQDM